MPYATRADLVDRFGDAEIEQRESMLPVGAVEKAIADAGAEIDGFIGRQVTLPLVEVPDLVRRLACDIARYRLLGDAATEDARGRYRDALGLLKDIGAGRLPIGVVATGAVTTSATVEVVSGRRVFGRPLL